MVTMPTTTTAVVQSTCGFSRAPINIGLDCDAVMHSAALFHVPPLGDNALGAHIYQQKEVVDKTKYVPVNQ